MRYVASVSSFNAFILSRRHRSHLDDGMIERMHVRVAPVALEFRLFSGRRKFRILPSKTRCVHDRTNVRFLQ